MQTGFYVLEAIPPWCREVRVPVELISRNEKRVVLRDLDMAAKGVDYRIETDPASFQESHQ